MSEKHSLKPRTPRGMPDSRGADAGELLPLAARILEVYRAYGFEALETGALEYAEALGAFLPDQEQPNAGIFAFPDDDGRQLALRYDLTAPLARFAAQNFDRLPKPFRRCQWGFVFRNEKPGPGRFRQFLQIDADTVGAPPAAADAEMCMALAEALEAAGLPRASFCVRVNNRKLLDGLFQTLGLDPGLPAFAPTRLIALRAMDKYDRLGPRGVADLLGPGRRDPSGDFTRGAGLETGQIKAILEFLAIREPSRPEFCRRLAPLAGDSERGRQAIAEMREIDAVLASCNFDETRVRFDPAIVRGLAYYTGPVFEAAPHDAPELALGAGGRYDDLLSRFRDQPVPAVGVSIGASRLLPLLRRATKEPPGPIVVLALDAEARHRAQAIAAELRAAGLAAEAYAGSGTMRAQLKYADKRRAPLAVIEGGDERQTGEVTLKDLVRGAEQAAAIADNAQWRSGAHAQTRIKRADLVTACRAALKTGRAATSRREVS